MNDLSYDALLAEVRRLTAEREDTCRTLRALLADPGDDLSGADLGELLEMAQASIHGLQVRADTNRAWAEDYRAERDQARAELEDARREERARCADAVSQLAQSGFTAMGAAMALRGPTLPDEDTPTTEEAPVSAELPDYIEIAYSHITRSWGVTCTTCPHKMRNAGATEDAAVHVARMHLDHDHRGWNTTA